MKITIQPLGDRGIRLSIGNKISPEIHHLIRQYSYALENLESLGNLDKSSYQGIVEWVPAYHTLTVFYHPEVIPYADLKLLLEKIGDQLQEIKVPDPLVYEIPTLYGGETGPDLSYVAKFHGLSEAEVITLHSRPTYFIYMLGFMPGFPYLGGLPAKISTPRLKTPRPRVEAGSVGIAENQTGIYPLATPGGWQIIGKTPVKLYDPQAYSHADSHSQNQISKSILLPAGNHLKFVPISKEEYSEIEKKIEQGFYSVRKTLA